MRKSTKKREIHVKKKLTILILLLLLFGLSIHLMIRFSVRIGSLESAIQALQTQLSVEHAHATQMNTEIVNQAHTIAQLKTQLAQEHALNQAIQQKISTIQPTNTGYVAKFNNIPTPHASIPHLTQPAQHVAEAGAIAGVVAGAGKLLANLWEFVAPVI